MLKFTGSSADLIADDNFIVNETQLDDITPITYEQNDYQNGYELATARDTVSNETEECFIVPRSYDLLAAKQAMKHAVGQRSLASTTFASLL